MGLIDRFLEAMRAVKLPRHLDVTAPPPPPAPPPQSMTYRPSVIPMSRGASQAADRLSAADLVGKFCRWVQADMIEPVESLEQLQDMWLEKVDLFIAELGTDQAQRHYDVYREVLLHYLKANDWFRGTLLGEGVESPARQRESLERVLRQRYGGR